MHVAERQDYHLIDDLLFSNKILKIRNFCWRFSRQHHFRHRYQSGPVFSEMKNDADLIFIAVWQQMIGFSNMTSLFYLKSGPYSYLDFKRWSPSKFQWYVLTKLPGNEPGDSITLDYCSFPINCHNWQYALGRCWNMETISQMSCNCSVIPCDNY